MSFYFQLNFSSVGSKIIKQINTTVESEKKTEHNFSLCILLKLNNLKQTDLSQFMKIGKMKNVAMSI